jgi:uncharacterized protein (DUF1501 family)
MRTTRRQFLSTAFGSAAVVSLGVSTPEFLLQAALHGADASSESILVVVQLSGGNDGLNTIVPYADQEYYKQRPTLAVARSDVLKINTELGWHPSMQGCASLMEAGQLAVVQGVGYANPNRSHFESMDIWHTCRRKGQARNDGWLGRYLDAFQDQAGGDVPALHLGAEEQPLALTAQNVQVSSVQSLDRFRLVDGERDEALIQQVTSTARDKSGLLSFVQSNTQAALSASERIEQATKDYKTNVAYPQSALARKLKTVAQLIDAGLKTRIYYVILDGFDTHSRQAAAHNALLRQFSDALQAFVQDCSDHGHGQRVMVMAFSEFGRRVKENASEGTDHGAAAPMILAGEKITAQVSGRHPSLTDLEDGDLKFHTDFRQVYATVLEKWLGCNSVDVLGKHYDTLDLWS